MDYEISLAGNFGEPRPHHFHGGLDIRTDGVEGKHIYAIGDGYVSRVTVGLYGFGNAVYITHPTGQTSVYCHLKSFSPRIKAALRKYQYQHQTSVADARLTPLDVPVARGQFIALSGNSGHSTAPHLHLEMHDTKTWNMLDPYQFLNEFIQDTVPPQVHSLMAIPQGGTFNGSGSKQTFARNSSLTAWGRVGFAVWADDYMQGAYNHYGIHETLLYVDGQMVFHSVVNDIPTALNRMVNSWGNYDHWLHHRTWYMKSYKEPGNTLAFLKTDANRGIVNFNEERDYQLEYVLRDFKGNEVRYPFTVRGGAPSTTHPSPFTLHPSPSTLHPSPLTLHHSPFTTHPSPLTLHPSPLTLHQNTLRWNRTNSISRPGMQLIVPYGYITVHTPLTPIVSRQPDALSDAYQLAASSLPLMYDAELSIYVRNVSANNVVNLSDPSKLYITDEAGHYMGGEYNNGWVTGRVRELGSRYQVAYDDQPPTVRPLSLSGDRLTLSATDDKSGIAAWSATVDGRFIVFDAIEKSSVFACELKESWLRRNGQPHRLRFEVTDNRQNTQIYETTFNY